MGVTEMLGNMGIFALILNSTLLAMAIAAVTVAVLHRRLELLKSIGWTAPMLGLLGAVIGLMNGAQAVYFNNAANTDALVGGAIEALFPLIFGLVIGVASLWAHWATNGAASEAS